MNLTPDEVALLNEKCHPHTWSELVSKWAKLTKSLDGYDYSIYDFDNDVSVRSIIQSAINASPKRLQDKALALLKEHDERFLKRTKPVERLRYEVDNWHSRIPIHPGAGLQEDIDSGNL